MAEWHEPLAETMAHSAEVQRRLEQHMRAIRDWFLEER
jgi:hypothetical protein